MTYDVTKIEENFYSLMEQGMVRSFLFIGKDKNILIDTGFGTGDIKSKVLSINDKEVMLINTHADRDHVGCNNLFEKSYMHPSEYERFLSANENLINCLNPLWEGDIVDIGTFKFEVIHIPGHTPGSIALLEREKRFLIGGDSIQKGSIFMFGEGRNLCAYIDSMKKMLKYKDCFDKVYASHHDLFVLPETIDLLISGATDLLNGNVTGKEPQRDLPCKQYDTNGVSFLY